MSEGTGSRSRARHLGPERRRPQVLDAALAIAVDQGVAAVTIGAVADRVGVTRPVVYACFADRVELLRELLRREEEYLLNDALAALPHGRADADESVFTHGFQALLETVAKRPDSWRIVFDADPDPAVADLFGRGRAVVAEHVTRLLRPTLKQWGTRDADRKLPVLVEHFMSASEGAVRSLLREGAAWSPAELGAFVGSAVYRAFRDA
ncbi:TetR/AcrR family transcriptional regulator [Amycolatopsis sp. NPDC059021]|uniref:TetR/AcrR family transcriptional regulator n=1 Tax=Amycolatopsis sp. NPDC059021 TaxID=3346704 RepID=UPI00366BD008